MKHIAAEGDVDSVLNTADVVIYGSFLEEQTFPEILVKALCFRKPIIAPDLSNIRKYVWFISSVFYKDCHRLYFL